MSRHDDRLRLTHMRDHAREAVEFARGRTRADLETDRLLNLALVRLIEIVGEAANQVSDRKRAEITTLPWPEIIGTRNRIVHGYDDIDFDILWDTIHIDLPPLIAELDRILGPDAEG